MKLIQEEKFFSNLNLILPEIKKVKLYNQQDFISLRKQKANWPGLRSFPLTESCPILHELIIEIFNKKKILQKGSYKIASYLHLRLEEDKKRDWIHQDEDELAALIYISKTNLDSGTFLFDDKDNLINDIKFVQNRIIIFSGKYRHAGYGHHGSSIDDGRLTINLFINKV